MPKRKPTSREPTLAGRLALITGANRGIGLAIARALARAGCNLIITARDDRALAKARHELEKLQPAKLHLHVLAQSCDVRSPESVDYLFTLVRGIRKPLDILINNAGIAHPNLSVGELPYPTWMEVIDTNLSGLFLMTQAALAVMKRRKHDREQSLDRRRARLPGIGSLQRIEARRARIYQHIARRVEAKGNSRDRPHARRHRYGALEHAVAQSAQAQNDVRRNRRPHGGECTALARKYDRRKGRTDALKRRTVGDAENIPVETLKVD